MAEIFHLRCHYCGDPLKTSGSPYCSPCNTYLMYRAMPILLGMMMTAPLVKRAVPVSVGFFRGRKRPYPHLNEIMD